MVKLIEKKRLINSKIKRAVSDTHSYISTNEIGEERKGQNQSIVIKIEQRCENISKAKEGKADRGKQSKGRKSKSSEAM